MSKIKPTLTRCPYCGDEVDYAVIHNMQDPAEAARREKKLASLAKNVRESVNVNLVEVELLRPCNHAFPVSRVRSIARAIRATDIHSPETLDAVNAACAVVVTIPERVPAERDGSGLDPGGGPKFDPGSGPGPDGGSFTPPK